MQLCDRLKGETLNLKPELLALSAKYCCQDGDKEVGVGFNNQNLEVLSIFIRVH